MCRTPTARSACPPAPQRQCSRCSTDSLMGRTADGWIPQPLLASAVMTQCMPVPSRVMPQTTRSRQSATNDTTRRRPAGHAVWPAWAGILGPSCSPPPTWRRSCFASDEYSPIAEPVSALEAGPHGWVQQANFVVFGLLTLAFAVGLHRGIRPSRAGLAGPALFFASGIGLLLAAILPLREDASGTTYDPGGHFVAGVVFFLSSAAGTGRPVATDEPRSCLAEHRRPDALAPGCSAWSGFVTLGVLAIPDGAPLHDWAGLAQRVVLLGRAVPRPDPALGQTSTDRASAGLTGRPG